MLGLFIFVIFLGFPIAFTMMAMGIIFGYFAYYEPDRMWRGFNRLDETASTWDAWSLWLEGFFNNRIFDLFINQTYTVMSNDVLTGDAAVPVHGLHRRARQHRRPALHHAQHRRQGRARLARGRRALHLLALRHRHRHRRRRRHADGAARLPADAEGRLPRELRLRHHLRRRHARHPDPALDHADRLCRDLRRLDRAALRRRAAAGLPAGRALHPLRDDPRDPAAVGRAAPAQGGHPRGRRCRQLRLDDR